MARTRTRAQSRHMTAADAGTPDARAVLALLANDDARAMIARISLGQQIAARHELSKRESTVLDRLLAAAVILEGDGGYAINSAGLRAAVDEYSPPRPQGIDRFVRDGRIVNYPASDTDRIAVLEWIGARILAPGERIDEREINERLHPYMEEHVLLRRYLVDYGVIDRNSDGTGYELAPDSNGAT